MYYFQLVIVSLSQSTVCSSLFNPMAVNVESMVNWPFYCPNLLIVYCSGFLSVFCKTGGPPGFTCAPTRLSFIYSDIFLYVCL